MHHFKQIKNIGEKRCIFYLGAPSPSPEPLPDKDRSLPEKKDKRPLEEIYKELAQRRLNVESKTVRIFKQVDEEMRTMSSKLHAKWDPILKDIKNRYIQIKENNPTSSTHIHKPHPQQWEKHMQQIDELLNELTMHIINIKTEKKAETLRPSERSAPKYHTNLNRAEALQEALRHHNPLREATQKALHEAQQSNDPESIDRLLDTIAKEISLLQRIESGSIPSLRSLSQSDKASLRTRIQLLEFWQNCSQQERGTRQNTNKAINRSPMEEPSSGSSLYPNRNEALEDAQNRHAPLLEATQNALHEAQQSDETESIDRFLKASAKEISTLQWIGEGSAYSFRSLSRSDRASLQSRIQQLEFWRNCAQQEREARIEPTFSQEQQKIITSLSQDLQAQIKSKFPDEDISCRFEIGPSAEQANFVMNIDGIERRNTFHFDKPQNTLLHDRLLHGNDYGLYVYGKPLEASELLQRINILRTEIETNKKNAANAPQQIEDLKLLAYEYPNTWLQLAYNDSSTHPNSNDYLYYDKGTGTLYSSGEGYRNAYLYEFKDGAYVSRNWKDVNELPDKKNCKIISKYEHERAMQSATEKKEAEHIKQENDQLLQEASDLLARYVREAQPLITEAERFEDCHTWKLDDAYKKLQELVPKKAHHYIKQEIERYKEGMTQLRQELAEARQMGGNLIEKRDDTLTTTKALLDSLKKYKRSNLWVYHNLSDAVDYLERTDMAGHHSWIQDKIDAMQEDIAEATEVVEREEELEGGKADLETIREGFGEMRKENERAYILGAETSFKEIEDAYNNLYDATRRYKKEPSSLGEIQTCRKALSEALEKYNAAITEKKSLPPASIDIADIDNHFANSHAEMIEKYELLHAAEGRLISLNYGNSRYYRSGDSLFYSGSMTSTAGGAHRAHQILQNIEDRTQLCVLTEHNEFISVEEEKNTKDYLHIYRTNDGRLFNEFGTEYKNDPTGLYKLQGENGFEKEEYVAIAPDGNWRKFTVNDEGIGWGSWEEEKLYSWSDSILITSENHTRMINAAADTQTDSSTVKGEFIQGARKWEYENDIENNLITETNKIKRLYPLLDEARYLLYEGDDKAFNNVYKDAEKLQKIEALLPDLSQAYNLLEGKGNDKVGTNIFEDYKEAYKIMAHLRSNPVIASYLRFEQKYCDACFKAGKRHEGIRALRQYLQKHPNNSWAQELLVTQLGTHPTATPEEQEEALELAKTYYGDSPDSYDQALIAILLQKNGKHDESIATLLKGKDDEKRQKHLEILQGLPQDLQIFLQAYGYTEQFENGIIKGNVDISHDSFEKFPEGITKIEGDLTISSTNFKGLSHSLNEITGMCTIRHSSALQSLADAGLERVDSQLMIVDCPYIQELPHNLNYVRHLLAASCTDLKKLPPHLHVEVGAYLDACKKIEKIPPGFKAGYLAIPKEVKDRSK